LGASVAKNHDVEAHVFNAGSSIGNVRKGILQKPKKEKERKNIITHYHSPDIISAGAVGSGLADKTINVKCKNKSINCHSIKNFT
jgi:hypothetical protein